MHRSPPLLYFGVKGPPEEQRVAATERSTMTRRSHRVVSSSVLQAQRNFPACCFRYYRRMRVYSLLGGHSKQCRPGKSAAATRVFTSFRCPRFPFLNSGHFSFQRDDRSFGSITHTHIHIEDIPRYRARKQHRAKFQCCARLRMPAPAYERIAGVSILRGRNRYTVY